MRDVLNGVLLSFSYFTVIPVKIKNFRENNILYNALLFSMPFVAMLMALLCIGLYKLLTLIFPDLYAAFLSAIVYICLYGFLHLEAVTDVIDGWFASFSNKDVYEVMKDPTAGAIGAVGTAVVMLLKVVGVAYLLYAHLYEYFLVATILSRYALFWCLMFFDFHEKSKFARILKARANGWMVFFGGVFYLSFIYLVLGLGVFIYTIFAIIFFGWILNVIKNRIGFLNGDCIGAAIAITELLLLNIGLGGV